MSPGVTLSTNMERLLLHTRNQGSRSSQERPALDYKPKGEPPLLSATITDLCNEPLFFNSYLSEEEDSSASEEDDMSFSSTSTHQQGKEVEAEFDSTLPEFLAEECTFVARECNKAKAVLLVAAGRPRLIQVAKAHIRPSPPPARHSATSGRVLRRSASRIGPPSMLSIRQHSREVSESSSSSYSVPGTPELPSTPLLESGLQTPTSACTPLTPDTTHASFHFDPLASPTPTYNASMTASTRARPHTQFRVEQPSMAKRSISHMHTVTLSLTGRPSLPLSAPLSAPPIYSFRPKMVARAANERSSMLELPPFPSDDAMRAVKPTRPWALRKDSFGPVLTSRDNNKTAKPRMRKVESAFGLNRW